jgi:hypothetical protein
MVDPKKASPKHMLTFGTTGAVQRLKSGLRFADARAVRVDDGDRAKVAGLGRALPSPLYSWRAALVLFAPALFYNKNFLIGFQQQS